jgi:ABC-type branched-subunit amino acid transport system substrate-binding protein
MTNKTVESHVAAGPESSDSITPDRRTVVKGVATAGLAAGVALPTYLRGFETSAYAQTSAPVKMGFIEDESGNLSVYGIQKLHAAQLAVAEINDGKTSQRLSGHRRRLPRSASDRSEESTRDQQGRDIARDRR